MVAEVVSEQSYRRASKHIGLIGGIPVPKSTAHRWVMQSNCDKSEEVAGPLDLVISDGTGYKRRPEKSRGVDNHGQVRVALGVEASGRVVPLGAWSGLSWDEIGTQIAPKGGAPIARMLVSDGEPGLAEGLAHLVNDAQRCHWHLVRDLDFYMWRDGAGKDDRRLTQKGTAAILGIELPKEDFEEVASEDRTAIEDSVRNAEAQIDELVRQLEKKQYHRAARYVSRAKSELFSYVRFWLSYGLVSPRVSSMIERMMREIGRRLKRIASGWSEAGAAKMTRIIIKRITSADQWDIYWQQRLRITGDVILIYRGVHVC